MGAAVSKVGRSRGHKEHLTEECVHAPQHQVQGKS